MELRSKIEALLYASETPLSSAEIAEIAGASTADVYREIRRLSRSYDSASSALEVRKVGNRYKLQLREAYLDLVVPVSQPEFRNDELMLLGFVAAHPSCKRGDLRTNFGADFDSTVDKFIKRGFLSSERYRNTELFTVTKKFYRYFNITDRQVEDYLKSTEKVEE
ncbi:MAG: SMC-Scp complex subunit ScpB [Candidatus Thermoplasmatota archaeon]|jgi:chromosome segregation and condensation protein ScpB|nr:SMC-Scp complex subunit ScpB [Candidatus Thermoplasmatota archaeon]MCL5793551.1 SMC-Scp complex subunit ScpB [Candidatus Thermoplasmatota archaeon]